jgi:putative ABC transport system permease protein
VITRRFPLLFFRQGLRAIVRHPVLLLLNVLSIALGVAVFLSIQIANRSANESFRAGVELVAGRANLEVRGKLDENLFPRIARLDGVRSSTPLVEGVVTLPEHPGEYLRIIGVDPFSGSELRTFELLGANRAKIDLETWLREPDAIAISPEYARSILPKVGNPVRVSAGGTERTLRPVFVIEPATASGDPRVAAMDIGWAQELLHKQGQLTTILLLVAPDKLAAVRDSIRRMVPADIEVTTPSLRSGQVELMLRSFQLNLTALSLVSVLIGAFLIYNTISASVVRRRVEIGILRALGASRAEVRLLFLGEAAFAGIAGSLLGAVLALPLASALSAPLSQTIRSLYILTSVERLYLSPWQFAEAFAVGIGAALLAGWVPASEAARANPAQALHPGTALERTLVPSPAWPVAGGALLAAAAVLGWITLSFHLPLLGFASALSVLAGFSLLVPAVIRLAASLLRAGPRYLQLAAENLARFMPRTAVTVAALAAAIAMSVSVSVMIHSFRTSVDDWIESTLVDDLFIGVAEPNSGTTLPKEAEEWLRRQPSVKTTATRVDTTLSFRGEPIEVAVLSGTRPQTLHFLGPDASGQFADFLRGDAVIISEPFANRFRVQQGDRIELPTPRGLTTFRVAGVFRDYARSNGVVMIQRKNFERYWEPLAPQSVAITFTPGADAGGLEAGFRARFGSQGQFSIYSNRALKEKVFEIFDQTFAVTLVLRAISVLVAAAGVTLSLLILGAERERETGVLRAIGASRSQVVSLFLHEAGLIGLISSLVGVASGASLAMVLTWVVNKAFFGWTIQLSYPAGTLLATPLWIVPVALLAALLPAWQSASRRPARAIRFE